MAAIFWKTGISGNWSLASNWTSGTVPNGADDVTINAAGAYTVTVDGDEEVNSLTFNAPNAVINFATSSDFLLATGATIAGGKIDGPGTLYSYVSGVWSITSGMPLTLGGGLNWTIYSSATVNDAGVVNVGAAAGLTVNILNEGTYNLTTDTAGIGLNSLNVGGPRNRGSPTLTITKEHWRR